MASYQIEERMGDHTQLVALMVRSQTTTHQLFRPNKYITTSSSLEIQSEFVSWSQEHD